MTCFSPLLIGDRFEARMRAMPARCRSVRFSPLLIGDRFEARAISRKVLAMNRFSPLLIGDRFEAQLESAR